MQIPNIQTNISKIYNLSKLLFISTILFLIFSFSVGATAPTITGNATTDMSTLPGVNHYVDPLGDVGVPAAVGPASQTGWNIIDTYVWYDVTTDKLYVGIHCVQICGDADGDGNPATTSAALAAIPGSDTDWGPGETAAFIVNTNSLVNTNFNVAIGKRPNNSGIATWGLYYFNQPTELDAGVDSNWLLPDNTLVDPTRPPFIATSSVLAFTHDLEFVINQFSTLKGANLSNMKIGAFMGSSTDDGIGEDTIAGAGTPFSIQKLTVIKKVINDNGGLKNPIDFPLSVDNGIGTVITNVPNSVLTSIPYTISETQQAGYLQVGAISCVDDTTGGAVSHPVTFSAGQNVTCTITNDDIAPKLKVVKTMINDNGGTKVASDFPLSISPTIGAVTSGVQNTVKAGVAYTPSEIQQPGYAQVSIICKDDAVTSGATLSIPVTLQLAQNATCTIVNDDIAPKLTLVKVVVNNNGGTTQVGNFGLFDITAGQPGISYTSGSQKTVSAGALKVSEGGASGYTMTSLVCVDDTTQAIVPNTAGAFTIGLAQNVTCTFTNDDIAPKVKVIKQVINNNGGTKVVSDFPLAIDNGIGAVTSGVSKDVTAGVAYTVSETQQSGYTQVSNICIYDGSTTVADQPFTLLVGQSVTCTIINDDIAPKFTVKKIVVNDNGGTKVVADFPLNLSPTIGTVVSGVQTIVSPGVAYTPSETQQVGYTLVSTVCKDDAVTTGATLSVPVTLSLAQNVTCTLTNDDIPSKLTITKIVINDNGGNKVPADFNLFDNATKVVSGVQNTVLPGVHAVTEQNNPAGYLALSTVCKDDDTGLTVTNNPVTLALGQKVTCTLTNDDIASKITVVKKVINSNGGTKVVSDFKLFIDGAPTLSSMQIDTKSNTPHTVSETEMKDYSQISLVCKDDATGTVLTHPVTLNPGQAATCTITNMDTPPACIGDRVFEDLNGNGIEDSGEPGIPNAILTITLLDGTTKTTTTDATGLYSFCNLPSGTYTVKTDKTQNAITSYPNFSYGFDTTTPQTYTQTLKSGDFFKDADFGFISYAKIGDQVFIDKDKNCIFDGDNKGVLGVKVNLKDSTGKILQSTLTDKDGFYYFYAVSGKVYTVEIDPAWKTNPVLDLATPNCGVTKNTPNLTTHQTYLDADFGFDQAYPFDIHDPAQSQCLGVNIYFIIDIKNTSSLTAKNVLFTDQLPDGINFVSFTSTGSATASSSSVVGNTLKVKFDSMPGNSVITMNVVGISTKAGSGLTNTSFASDETGLLISHIEKADIQIQDSGMPACKLPVTGASSSPLMFIALTMFGLGVLGYKFSRKEL